MEKFNLKKNRKAFKKTQVQAAALAQTCVRNYQNWENGTTTPPPFNIELLRLEYKALDLGFNSLRELLISTGHIKPENQPDPLNGILQDWYFETL